MRGGLILALIMFAAGVFLLLGWLYFTAENPRANRLLLKSLGFFVLPGLGLAFVARSVLALPFAMFAGTLIEECLKATAAATEQKPTNRFWLVSLFGVWEFMLAKPLVGFVNPPVFQDWTPLEAAGLTAAALVGVLMHTVTAEIYAFRFGGRIPAALLASWVLHSTFNLSVDWLGVSVAASLIQLLPVFLLFIALWPRGGLIPSRQ